MSPSVRDETHDTPDDDAAEAALAAGPRGLSSRAYGTLLTVLGAIGFGAASWLAIEEYLKLLDPNRVTTCSFNVFLDCGVAMMSWQGTLLGFPNPYLGVAAFPVVVTTGVVLLAGARLPRWYHLALLAVTAVAQLLIFFLMWTSFYALVRLCPACMVVWTILWPLLWFQVVHAVQERHLPVSDGLRRAVVRNRGLVLIIGYVVAVGWLLAAVGGPLVESFGV
ncbi:vitamin K epoxide reductase family protein [Isoptericola sp. NPDC057559]|uniref:vitamin K epoxide reductase family protein n=1 Tax=Isoptericola sp. NPDC057559 TaxID=3346168 RepID=UPI0036BE42A8